MWQRCTEQGNKATEAGTVLVVGRSNHTFVNCSLAYNSAAFGGAIRAAQESKVAVADMLLQHNSAPKQTRGDGGNGSGIVAEEESQVRLHADGAVGWCCLTWQLFSAGCSCCRLLLNHSTPWASLMALLLMCVTCNSLLDTSCQNKARIAY
jgi:hypothetical protein